MRTIQVTIAGKDSGGYIFNNVQHYQTPDDTTHEHELLAAMNAKVQALILPPMQNAMVDGGSIFSVASKIIDPTASYSLILPVTLTGGRVEEPAVGAVCGKIALYPDTGANVGHQFISGTADVDYVADVVQPGYTTFLQAIGDALIAINGTAGPFNFQFVIWNRKLKAAVKAVADAVLPGPGILGKRTRT